MGRYIDADGLWMDVIRAMDYADDFLQMIEEAPTSDVRENVHGENISENGFLCSVCGFGDFGGFHGYEPTYCPNCGSLMSESLKFLEKAKGLQEAVTEGLHTDKVREDIETWANTLDRLGVAKKIENI